MLDRDLIKSQPRLRKFQEYIVRQHFEANRSCFLLLRFSAVNFRSLLYLSPTIC